MLAVAIVAILLVAIAIAVIVFRSRRTIVLGVQSAEADARDRRHREQFAHLPSPLPSTRYESFTLIDPTESARRTFFTRRAESPSLQMAYLGRQKDLPSGGAAKDPCPQRSAIVSRF